MPARNIGKERTATRKMHRRRARQMERVVSDVEKEAEHIRAANDGAKAPRCAEFLPGLIESGALWIPQQRLGACRIGCKRFHTGRQDQSMTSVGVRSAFMRMTSMHDKRCAGQTVMEELLV